MKKVKMSAFLGANVLPTDRLYVTHLLFFFKYMQNIVGSFPLTDTYLFWLLFASYEK